MTECNSKWIAFSSVGRRAVLADFAGGSITSDAGAILLREADRRLGFVNSLVAVIPDPRNQQLITHQQSTMLRQRIFAIAMGYEDGCEHHNVGYIVGLAKNKRLQPMTQATMDQARELFEKANDGQPTRVFTEFSYAAGTWDKERRVITKAEYLGPPQQGKSKENYRLVVTNLTEDGPWLYEKFYCKRGNAENRIKEQQLGLFADRTSCHEFVPNQFHVMLSVTAYVLLQHIRQTMLAGTELAEAQVSTIRLKLLKIGGLVKRSARRIVLHLARGCPQQQLFCLIAAKLISAPSTARRPRKSTPNTLSARRRVYPVRG